MNSIIILVSLLLILIIKYLGAKGSTVRFHLVFYIPFLLILVSESLNHAVSGQMSFFSIVLLILCFISSMLILFSRGEEA